MRAFTLFPIVVLSLLFWPTPGFAEKGKQTTISFGLSGEVKDVSQAVAKFSQNMVAFGDPTVESPFTVSCNGLDPAPKDMKEVGSARWLGPKEWAYDFVKPLPAGVKCEFGLRSGVKNLAGESVTAAGPFGFTTGGPAVRSTRPWEGSSGVEEDQAFVLELDAAPEKGSVEKNAYFEIAGQGNRVGFRWITGSDRKLILKSAYKEDKDNVLVIQADQKFPPDTKIALVWGKGIQSKSGVATTKDQTTPFTTRENFKVEFRCERENLEAGCSPVGHLSVQFSSSIKTDDADKVRIKTDKGVELQRDRTREREEWTRGVYFKGPFPENTALVVELPKGLVDDAGRKLTNADKFPLKTRTDRFPPLAKFAASFGILEAGSPGKPALLPVTIRNLEPEVKLRLYKSRAVSGGVSYEELDKVEGKKAKIPLTKKTDILAWIRRLEKNQHDFSIFEPQIRQTWQYPSGGGQSKQVNVVDPPPEKVSPKPFALPRKEKPQSFEVVGIPLEEPGFYIVEVDSAALGQALNQSKKSYHAPTAVLVTDLAVHFKWGRESSLAWVTRLKDGSPVSGANVEAIDCHGKVVASGKSDSMGIVAMKVPRDTASCSARGDWHQYNSGLMVTAELKGDLSFVHTSMNEGIQNWRFSVDSSSSHDPVMAHAVLDRPLFRAGETMHMKTFLRKHTALGIGAVTAAEKPTKYRIRHAGTDQKFDFPIKWEPTGYFAAEWKIPKDAKLGHYYIELVNKGKRETTTQAGYFRVEEFRVPLLKGTIQATNTLPVRPKEMVFDTSVSYQAGGPAAGLPVKLRFHQIADFSVSLDDFSDYRMANGSVKEGRTKRGGDEESSGQANAGKVETQAGELDATGAKRFTVKGLTPKDTPYRILTELEYADPNGEIQTQSMSQTVYPSSALVGVKPDGWVASKDQLKIAVAVANIDGKPIANRKVEVVLFEKKTYSHRKRLVGGYYAYENTEEIKKLGSFCDGETNVRGILICEAKPPQTGNLIAQAVVEDSKGNKSVAHHEVWVPGAEEWWFPVSDNDRMDLMPERKRYEPGEKAKIQVRSPFREATLLVTVEREGILESFVQKVSGKAPVIEVPLQSRYAPNAFISVLAVRGRSGEAQPTALVDLGKPAYKLGITQVDVGWGAHELKVKVTTPKPVFRVREKVPVEITVQDPAGKAMKNADVTVAAVDEGLLNLMPNDTWDLLTQMMRRRPYEVENSTASMHVIGKRHFGLKALPAGGGGGQPTRELFDTLLYWKASIKTDAKGKATVSVPLNDSLTSFRIVAIAAADVDKFGTGKTNVRTHQDLMLFSGVSPLAREGDRTEALLTVRNASDGPLSVNASVLVHGLKDKLPPQKATLKGGESKIFTWGIPVPKDAGSLVYTFDATTSSKAKDRVKFTQKIIPAVPVRVLQANLSQVDKPVEVPVEIPKTAIPGRGGIRVSFEPTLLAGAESIKSYMKDYPYTCMEQEVSRAVALRDPKLWKTVVKTMPMHLDGQGFLKYFPSMREGSEVLTAYVLAVAHEAGWEIPTGVQSSMVSALQSFVAGTVGRGVNSPAPDLVMRKITVLEALSRVAGAYQAKYAKTVEYNPNLWPTSSVIEWRNMLARTEAPDKAAQWKEINTILRARINVQGTSLAFSTEKSDNLWWLMASVDTNAVRAILSLADDAEWKEDMPRIMRGAIARQRRGHWDLTLANAWGMLALEKFAKNFEAGEVTGSSQVALGDQTKSREWTKESKTQGSAPLMLAWPLAKGTLALKHSGSGKPWAIFQSLAAIPLTEPLASGFRIEKTITAIERKDKGKWNVGDVVRVSVKVRSDADQSWVVVNDPIPAGASVLGGGLNNTSALLTQDEKAKGWAWPAFTERSFEGMRNYYEWVEKGEFTTEYTVRLNQAGKFSLPPTRVEAMYRPEAFGELPNSDWEISR